MQKAGYVGFLIKQISEQTDKRIIRDFKKYDITCTQHRTLLYLMSHDGKASQKDIEMYLEVSHPTVVGILSALEAKGFVTCAFDNDDKRMKSVYITNDGVALMKKSKRDAEAMGNILYNGISEDEIDRLIATLEKLKSNLK